MRGLMNIFDTLNGEDIEEKIKINQRDWGYSLCEFKQHLEIELAQHERAIIRIEFHFTKLKWFRAVFLYQSNIKELLPYKIQSQNLREQITYINNKILDEESPCQQVTRQA